MTNVVSQTQKIIVNPATYSVSVINAGPMGPTGLTGPSDTATYLTVDGQILTRVAGLLAPITRVNLAADPAFTAGLTAHVAAADPHPGYMTTAEDVAIMSAHVAAADPHPGYMTTAEDAAIMSAHVAAADPHPGYLTSAEGDTAYVNIGGDTMTAMLRLTLADDLLRLISTAPYISWYNAASSVRYGYIQGSTGGLGIASEVGTLTLSGPTLTLTGIASGSAIGTGGNQLVKRDSNGYIFGSYINMTANVLAGYPPLMGGVNNVSGDSYLRYWDKTGQLAVDGTHQTSGYGWSTQDIKIYSSGAHQCGITIYPTVYGTAPILRCYGPLGERLDAINNANSAYISLNASAFNVQSSIRIKQDISKIEDDELLSKISMVHTHRWFPKVRPLVVRPSERFTELDVRWQTRGKKPLVPTPTHLESHDHDCTIEHCVGNGSEPCVVVQNDTMRFGIIAEHLIEVAPEVVNLDEEGLPESYDVSQVAAMAFGGVGALVRQIKELNNRIATLEGVK